MIPSALRLLLPALLSIALSGCVSYWKGKDMEADIAALQGQVEQLSEEQRKQNERLVAEMRTTVTTLERRLGEAIEQLQRGSADSGLDLQRIWDEVRKLQGGLAELDLKVKRGAQPDDPSVTGTPAGPGGANLPALPQDEATLYRYGYERRRANDCDEAIRSLNVYASRFPGSNQADNALYMVAECQHDKKDHPGSIRTLQVILQKYPKDDKVDDALILMHDNFVALKRCKDGIPFLETMLADYPRSNRAAEARRKLANTKKTCK